MPGIYHLAEEWVEIDEILHTSIFHTVVLFLDMAHGNCTRAWQDIRLCSESISAAAKT